MKKVLTLAAIALAGSVFAGSHAVKAPSDHLGFFIGAGPSVSSLDVRYGSPFNVDNEVSQPFHNHQVLVAPVVQVGIQTNTYFPNTFLGAKVLYQHLGAELHNNLEESNASDVDDAVKTMLGAMVYLGRDITNHVSVHGGAGFSVFPAVRSTVYDDEDSYSIISHTLYGGLVELGLSYKITSCWVADFSWQYAVTGRREYRENTTTDIERYISVTNSQAVFTLNYVF